MYEVRKVQHDTYSFWNYKYNFRQNAKNVIQRMTAPEKIKLKQSKDWWGIPNKWAASWMKICELPIFN